MTRFDQSVAEGQAKKIYLEKIKAKSLLKHGIPLFHEWWFDGMLCARKLLVVECLGVKN